MLREIKIIKDQKIIFERNFGKALTPEQFKMFLKLVIQEIKRPLLTPKDVLTRYFWKYQIMIKTDATKRLVFMYITDVSDAKEFVVKEINIFVETFLNKVCATDANAKLSKDIFTKFLNNVDQTFRRLWPKISFIGFSGVGKTTIRKLLQNQAIPQQHIPTISGEIESLVDEQTGNFCRIWDYAGQEAYQNMWDKMIVGSEVVFIITDSTRSNCEKSVILIDLIKKHEPDAIIAVIANKQDMKGALKIDEIKEIFQGLDVFPLVATDINNRTFILELFSTLTEVDLHALQIPKIVGDQESIEGACSLDEIEHAPPEPAPTQELVIAPKLVQIPFNIQEMQHWILESWDIIKWILVKAKNREYPKRWIVSKGWLELQPDHPVLDAEFDLVYAQFENSPFVNKKQGLLEINETGQELLANIFEKIQY